MRILSIGDSWSAGAWDIVNGKHTTVDKGYQNVLAKYAHIDNVWHFSNRDTIFTYKKLHKKYDVVLIFVTDPFRDLTMPGQHHVFAMQTLNTLIEFKTAHRVLLNSFFQFFAEQKNVYFIGGCQSVKHIPNPNIIIGSASETVSKGKYKHPVYWNSGWSTCMDFNKCSRDLINFVYEQQKLQDAMQDYPKLFYPDGHHLNKKGNEILGEEIVKILQLK